MPSPGTLSKGHLHASDILSAPMHHGTDRNPQQPFLTPEERAAIDRGRWFSALSPSLRHDIFRLGTVTRYAHGDLIVEQGELAQHWFACASGAIRFRRTSPAGKLVTLAYVEPGIWVGEAEVLHSGPNTYDAHAHGRTTVLGVAEAVFRQLLREHTEFGEALLTLQARRMRFLYWMMKTWPRCPCGHGWPSICCTSCVASARAMCHRAMKSRWASCWCRTSWPNCWAAHASA